MRLTLALAILVALGSAACGDVVTAPTAVPAATAPAQTQDNIVWGS
jgi:hypothetical protein